MLAADLALLALIATLLVVGCATFHRLTNSTGTLKWEFRTVAPDARIKMLTSERDDARREAERLRAEIEGRL